jgi:hypothetical protein
VISELSRADSSLSVLAFVLRPLTARRALVPIVSATMNTFRTTIAPTAHSVRLRLCDTLQFLWWMDP